LQATTLRNRTSRNCILSVWFVCFLPCYRYLRSVSDSVRGADKGVEQNRQIHEEFAVTDVVEIIFDVLVNRKLPIRAQLPKTGNTRLDNQALSLQPSVLLDDKGHLRPRSDQGHFAFNHVQKLGDLIQACSSQESTHGADPCVGRFLRGGCVRLRIRMHGPEFVDLEPLSILPHPLVHKKHRSARGHSDEEGQD